MCAFISVYIHGYIISLIISRMNFLNMLQQMVPFLRSTLMQVRTFLKINIFYVFFFKCEYFLRIFELFVLKTKPVSEK